MSNLRYEMKEACLNHAYADGAGKQIQDKDSSRIYRKSIDAFCTWIKDTYRINNLRQLENNGGALKYVQEYERKLELEGKSASTIHTYLSPICKGLGLHLNEIRKPRRIASDMMRSRNAVYNTQGKRDALNDKFKRLVDFQKMTGLRRTELAKLRVNDFARDESGYLCVLVSRGKGGKTQLQRVLPEDVPQMKRFIKTVLDSIAGSDIPREKIRLFTMGEMDNKIDLHGLRAEQARRAYQVYLKRCETIEGKALLQRELVARWNACHGEADQIKESEGRYFAVSDSGKRFIREFSADGKYQLRGANKSRCMAAGRPVAYDRTALLSVSVFHLSHWRNDVTVKHYML